MWTAAALFASVFLVGCVSQSNDLVCPAGALRLNEQTQMDIYFTAGDIHGGNLAVSTACPDSVLVMEAGMATANERSAFWNRFRSLQPTRGQIPTGRMTISGTISPTQDGLLTLKIHQGDRIEQAFPPAPIAVTLHLDSQSIAP